MVEVWREWAELWGMVGAQELLQCYVHVVRLQEISQKQKASGPPLHPKKTSSEKFPPPRGDFPATPVLFFLS
jgi:hypothetical protein